MKSHLLVCPKGCEWTLSYREKTSGCDRGGSCGKCTGHQQIAAGGALEKKALWSIDKELSVDVYRAFV